MIGRLEGRLDANRPRPAAVRLTRVARRTLANESTLSATIRLELPESEVPDRFIEVPVMLVGA